MSLRTPQPWENVYWTNVAEVDQSEFAKCKAIT